MPGPHDVLRGSLALVGLPGVVCTPRRGLGLPAVAFGHGYLQPAQRYHWLLRHLASWGIVAAAPDTQRGPLPSHRLFAADLRTALDTCARVRLGDGELSVDAQRLGVAGHGMGGSSAVLAAADDAGIRAVATLALAESRPSAVDAAASCAQPSLHIAGADDKIAPAIGHAEPVARAWAGSTRLRSIDKATHLGFTEGRHYTELLLQGKQQRRVQTTAAALLTAFFLTHLADASQYAELLDADVKHAKITYRGTAVAAAKS